MKRLLTERFPLSAAFLLLALTLSCSHEPAADPQEPGGTNVAEWNDSAFNGDAVMNQMTFCIGDGITVKRDAATRATTDIDGVADFETGDLVAVAVTQGTSAEEIKLYRVKSDGSLEYAGGDNNPLIWKSATTPTTIRAWSYGTSTHLSYTLDAPESFDYSLTSNQQTNGYNELLYSKEAAISYATYSSSPIPLTFRHQLSRLVVNIEHDRTTTLTGTASMGDNVNNTFPITARFDTIGGGSWTPTAYGAITPKGETAQSGYEATYSAVVFPGTYAQNTKMFTLTNTDGDYVYAVSDASGQTLTAGNQYNYTILVKDDLCRRNPLWWVAQYNLASGGSSFVAAHSSASSQYVFTPSAAASETIANYHLPTHAEYRSIIPTDKTPNSTDIFSYSNALDDPYVFSELTCNIGGKDVASSTSYIGRKGVANSYAIRFIGTPYASAWHYQWVTSPCYGLLIESYMLQSSMTLDDALALLASWKDSTPPNFTGSLGSSSANQSPETTVVTTNGFAQRFFSASGYSRNSNYSNQYAGNAAYYWGVNCMFGANGDPSLSLAEYNESGLRLSVRLYKDDYRCSGKSLASSEVGDIICAHGKAYSPTTGSLPCGKEKVAIVAYRGNGEANENYNHGLAIAMNDVAGYYQWFTANSNTCTVLRTAFNAAIADYNGIEYTNRLATAACGEGHVHAAAQAAVNYENTVPHPNGTSQWFLPTIGQWKLMLESIRGGGTIPYAGEANGFKASAFSSWFASRGGTNFQASSSFHYWSSVETTTNWVWGVDFVSGSIAYYQKIVDNNKIVRPILAF